jgi:hypothetical protein
MTIEKEISELRAAIVALTEQLRAAPVAQAETKPKAEKKVEPKPKAEKKADQPTAQELQALCLALVRDQPQMKAKVKETVNAFGASTITKIDASKYADLKDALTALGG